MNYINLGALLQNSVDAQMQTDAQTIKDNLGLWFPFISARTDLVKTWMINLDALIVNANISHKLPWTVVDMIKTEIRLARGEIIARTDITNATP
jgi:hypothetical protein